jgi:hypothetical protein
VNFPWLENETGERLAMRPLETPQTLPLRKKRLKNTHNGTGVPVPHN